MGDDELALAELAGLLEGLAPVDVVPRGDPVPLNLAPGKRVTVRWPGEVFEDVAGVPAGVEPATVYAMTVDGDGVLAGWQEIDDAG